MHTTHLILLCSLVAWMSATQAPVWDGSMSWPFEPPAADPFSDDAVPVRREGQRLHIDLPANTMYLILEGDAE